MDFEFSAEQEELRSQLRRLFGDGRARARRAIARAGRYDRELWQQTVEIGVVGAAISESAGGVGLGYLELCIAAEEAGRTLAPIPLAPSVFQATEVLKRAGGTLAAVKLAELAAGRCVGTVAFNENSETWDRKPAARVTAERLYGVKAPIESPEADFLIISAVGEEDGEGFGCWLIDAQEQGITETVIDTVDCTRRFSRFEFDGVPAQRLGNPGEGAAVVSDALQIAAVLMAFEQLGGAEALLELTVDYAKTRRAFGILIGANQAVKHRLADMYTKIELARGHCYYSAWALSCGAKELPLAAAGARLATTDAFDFAAHEAIELHGGIGFTWDHDCHLYYRRARSLALELGNRERWSNRLMIGLSELMREGCLERVHGL